MQHEHSLRFSGKKISKLKNIKLFKLFANGILLPKLFRPTVRTNCSSDREKLLKFEADGWEFAKFLQRIYSSSEKSEQFLVTECFLTCSLRFLISNELEQLYTKSLVNTNSFYTNFTNTHFQKVPIPHLTRTMKQKFLH